VISYNAKDYLRFSVPVRDWRSCCASKKSDKAESAEGRSPVRAEQIILVIDNAKDYLRFSDPEGIGALVAQARRVTKLNLPKAAAR
jgi:hypothetical protein